MVEFKRVTGTQNIETVWPLVSAFLEAALSHSQQERSINDLYDAVCNNDYCLWVGVIDQEVIGACITFFVDFPNGRACEIAYYSDVLQDTKTWPVCLALMEEWARANNCKHISVTGRKGWGKTLQSYGYTFNYVKMGKLL